MTYNTPIPPQIMTPDTMETRLGTLNFVDGVPTAATTQLVYDNLDFMRGTEVFLNFVPACSIEAIRLSFIARGADKSNQAVIFDDLCDSNPLLLTANTDIISADKDGGDLDGACTYRLNIPANAPAKDFWSLVIYDPQTRSELQTCQPFPSKNSRRDRLIANADGSVDLYFGRQPPTGQEPNWIATIPGKGWFALFRLYGPLAPWFDKTWQPGEIELVQ